MRNARPAPAGEIDQRASGRRGHRQEELAPGEGGQAQDEANVWAEAATRDEYQALAALGELVGDRIATPPPSE